MLNLTFQVVVELQKVDLAGSQTDLGEYCILEVEQNAPVLRL